MTGDYAVSSAVIHWTFGGSLKRVPWDVAIHTGKDRVGPYHEISFREETASVWLTGGMRAYDEKPVVLFSLSPGVDTAQLAIAFPDFTTIPSGLHHFSYSDKVFSPPSFSAEADGSPWLLFDDQLHAAVISPAAHFAVSLINGDAQSRISGEFRPTLGIPRGFAEQTLLAIDQGINQTWETWGHALTDLQGKDRPANDADTILKYLGYWTDNGSFYYYNYDKTKGYAGTLLALADHFRQEQISVGYMQLDSWWYYKSLTNPAGKEGKPKKADLPLEEWNRYGGLMEFRAHPTVFPEGLAGFEAKLGMPLVVHNRWVDPKSPYRQKYKISGFAAVDPGYWKEIADYCKSSGAVTYEQDWLIEISHHSPEIMSTPGTGDAFLDGMANACRDDGLTVQYCMPLPWQVMQESRYSNLTTSRASMDRFEFQKWRSFLYTSRLVSAVGSWPWTDTLMSGETDNLLLSVLSAGAVGFGDAAGQEDKDNLLKAARADGVLVKPDAAIVPVDASYLSGDDAGAPIVSATCTDRNGLRTVYVFIFAPAKPNGEKGHFRPSDLGFTSPVYIFDFIAGTGRRFEPGSEFSVSLAAKKWSYCVVAPIGPSGIAFLGDKGKFVGTGKERIGSVKETAGGLNVDLVLAGNEPAVTLHGYAGSSPRVAVEGGTAGQIHFDSNTKYFTVEVKADQSVAPDGTGGDAIRRIPVRLETN